VNHHRISRILFAAFWLAASHAAPQAAAEQATIAVAANFSLPAAELAAGFARHSGHEVVIASGATGQFYAQILNGAPYDLFLAADQHRPMLLEQAGIAVAGTRFTYATGTLVLWSSSPDLLEDASLEILDSAHVRHIAIANPALAPYGAAARALLENSGQWLRLRPKLAIAQSVGQA